MLVLARKPSEAIKIGDAIVVKVIAIRGGQVKLGIEAPAGVRVIRTDSRPPNGGQSKHAINAPAGEKLNSPDAQGSGTVPMPHDEGRGQRSEGPGESTVPATPACSPQQADGRNAREDAGGPSDPGQERRDT